MELVTDRERALAHVPQTVAFGGTRVVEADTVVSDLQLATKSPPRSRPAGSCLEGPLLDGEGDVHPQTVTNKILIG